MTTPPASPAVAVIDIGSNSIKILVATRAPGGGLRVLLHRTINARISAGISQATPRLSAEGMSRGLDAVPGMVEALEKAVRGAGRPFLGICVGQQLMAERGLEFGVHPGLGWIAGDVAALAPADPALKIPHMGWNTLRLLSQHPVLAGIKDGDHAYFVHSFALYPRDPGVRLAVADYGGAVTAMIGRDNMVGTQFHPEKSQATGLRLIANFLKWRP